MPKKAKAPTKDLQYLGSQIKAERTKCGLTQQALADQAGRGLRHIQNIESGIINPSYEVLASIIHRLAMSADVLFYPDIAKVEEETKHLLCKFAACTENERKFLLDTVDFMVEQLIRHRHQDTSAQNAGISQ